MARFTAYLAIHKDVTLSAFLTQAGDAFITAAEQRGKGAR